MTNSAHLDNPSIWAPAVSRIEKLHENILGHAKLSLESAIIIGEILSEVRGTLKHGEWGSWIEKYLPFTERTARNYLRLFDNRDMLKSETVSDLGEAYSLLLATSANGESNVAQKLHEPNFHSQAVRLRQNLVGLFNHYLQRRPLKSWQTEEVYDLLCSLKPLTDVCIQLELELSNRNDAPASYGRANAA